MNIRYPLYEGVYRILTFQEYFSWNPCCKPRDAKTRQKKESNFPVIARTGGK